MDNVDMVDMSPAKESAEKRVYRQVTIGFGLYF